MFEPEAFRREIYSIEESWLLTKLLGLFITTSRFGALPSDSAPGELCPPCPLVTTLIVRKCEEWKEEAFLWSAPGDINIATPLQLCMRWDITSLVQSVNLICAKKVYYSNRPKYIFLCVYSRITSNILKTCFGQSEQVWMDEKLVTILLFEIQSSDFVFLNL